MEKENEYLNKITKELKEQLSEANSGYEINGNQKMRELNNLKNEIKLMNESSKLLQKNIKSQNNTINSLEKEIKKIKSNIDYEKSEREKMNNVNNNKKKRKKKKKGEIKEDPDDEDEKEVIVEKEKIEIEFKPKVLDNLKSNHNSQFSTLKSQLIFVPLHPLFEAHY